MSRTLDSGIRKREPSSFGRFQFGATAIETALVLPILLMMFYGIFIGGYYFVLFQSVNFAAQEGARAAVAIGPGLPFASARTAAMMAAGTGTGGALSFLPDAQKGLVTVNPTPGTAPSTIVVTVTIDTTTVLPAIPFLPAYLPPVLTGTAVGSLT